MSRQPPFEPLGFAEKLKKTECYASDNRVIYEWTGTHWQAVDDAMAERLALNWIEKESYGIAKFANANSAYKTALLWLPLIAQPTESAVIPLRNGYLHLEPNPVLKPHDKSLGLRHVLACDFDPLAPPPTEFNKFLERVLPDEEVRARVQEYIGYTLLPDPRFQRAQIWLGTGANGKGTLANLVQAMHERTAAVQLDCLDGFRMATMIGASLIYCDEAPQRNINEQAMKSLIAGELVQIDRKYRDPITTRVCGKWLILANHIPAVTDQSSGFWRRFDIVPFSAEIPEHERDPMLAKRIISHELSGVLNWAINGLLRLLERGRFDEHLPAAMRSATNAAKSETNSVQSWANDLCVELGITVETSKTDVYANYAAWCKDNGMIPVASPKFWKRLPDSIGQIHEGRMTTSAGRIRTCNVLLS